MFDKSVRVSGISGYKFIQINLIFIWITIKKFINFIDGGFFLDYENFDQSKRIFKEKIIN